jgi:hypothetical protein
MDKKPVKRYTDFKTLAEKHKTVTMEIPGKFRYWKCGGCGKLLGLIYSDGVLAVKYKDLTAWVTGTYKTVCRFCKLVNVFRSGQAESTLDDLTKNEEVK